MRERPECGFDPGQSGHLGSGDDPAPEPVPEEERHNNGGEADTGLTVDDRESPPTTASDARSPCEASQS